MQRGKMASYNKVDTMEHSSHVAFLFIYLKEDQEQQRKHTVAGTGDDGVTG